MREVWLRTNTRIYWTAVVVCAIGFIAGAAQLVVRGWQWPPAAGMSGLLVAMAGLLYAIRRPCLAYENKTLLLWLGSLRPIRVPINVVEGFLLGQGPSYLPGKRAARLDTTTLVVRLAEKFPEWERQPTNRRLASWCGHYVTIRGTWCEPLSLELVNRLNRRLYEVCHADQATAGVAS